MKNLFREIGLTLGQLDSRHIRLLLVLAILILFVLSAGAPATGGDPLVNGFSGLLW